MSQDDLARQLVEASGRNTLTREDISRWERGKRLPGPFWLAFVADVLEVGLIDMRTATQLTKRVRRNLCQPIDEGLSLLLLAGDDEIPDDGQRISVSDVERVLDRSYSLDDEFGGGALWQQVGASAEAATRLLSSSLTLAEGDRLRRALAGLTQVAGWLAIDASRHIEANKYLTTALYAAYETEDDAMAAHVLGYMSLHALYRNRLREAASLARAGVDRAGACCIPALRAILNARLARCCARLGEADACRRALEQSAHVGDPVTGEQPLWLRYVDAVELAAQRGACLLDLGEGIEAASTIEGAISLLQTHAPSRNRDLAHYKIRLAVAYLMQADPERAAVAAREAYDLTAGIDSARINDRLTELIRDLSSYDTAIVKETLASIDLH